MSQTKEILDKITDIYNDKKTGYNPGKPFLRRKRIYSSNFTSAGPSIIAWKGFAANYIDGSLINPTRTKKWCFLFLGIVFFFVLLSSSTFLIPHVRDFVMKYYFEAFAVYLLYLLIASVNISIIVKANKQLKDTKQTIRSLVNQIDFSEQNKENLKKLMWDDPILYPIYNEFYGDKVLMLTPFFFYALTQDLKNESADNIKKKSPTIAYNLFTLAFLSFALLIPFIIVIVRNAVSHFINTNGMIIFIIVLTTVIIWCAFTWIWDILKYKKYKGTI